ncbi:Dyp-type peroxidase [Pediococcus claussenii]|uniref:Peroxidase family protein n=1 Tax=Pediococcus claussenii (strain ATCC BAA-344 / DSM 14800 / JCM 18046 / KCTC 3811 / LMG 21948 / P06) TaxID=701521 RepID=G8PBC0_PEDCP|nr:Dyp-type peroxidase [Pediococcus claussenii]AEV95909.1 peroxidase family protein [Pediococcus claussenii ATCC BAA-344]KRN20514.1 hypothetical protein IV79_GL000571 [Pediococcus claussenii]
MPIDLKDTQDVYKDAGESVDFIILNLNRDDHEEDLDGVRELSDRIQAIKRSMRIRRADGNLNIAFGFSYSAWTYLFPNSNVPKELEDFQPIKGPKYTAVATPGDLFLHVRAADEGIVYEVVDQIMGFARDFTTVEDETKGFRYLEGRAIIGFIDGTENPEVIESSEYAVIGDEDPEFINGSYAFAQKYLHNMDNWKGLSTEDQEKAIGRRKYTDLELKEEEKLPNAHNIASKDEYGGVEHKIVRMNVPFSNPAENETGTYFIGYSRYFAVTKRMLINMFTKSDRILDFSTPISGTEFFIPSKSVLDQIVDGER